MNILSATALGISLLATTNAFSAFRSHQIHAPAQQAHKATKRAAQPKTPQSKITVEVHRALLQNVRDMLSRSSSKQKSMMAILNQANQKDPLVGKLKKQVLQKK